MAKELPYFKFEPNQWENGNIQICSRELKGLFIDLCAMYWSRFGSVPFKLAVQKLCAGNATALNSLCEENIIALIDGEIFIEFLDEQLNEFENTSKQNSKNAREGWEKRRQAKVSSGRNAIASNPQCESDAIREEKRREEKIREDKIKEEEILLKKEKKERFKNPKIEEIESYALEMDYKNFDSDVFFNFYESKGWMVGKSKMKNWKSAMAGWHSRNKNQTNTANTANTANGAYKKTTTLGTHRIGKDFSEPI